MNVPVPDYIRTIAYFYPGLKVKSFTPDQYGGINWGNETPVDQTTLDAQRTELYRLSCSDRVRAEAESAREAATTGYLGTADRHQLRTYDEKYEEALEMVADPLYPAVQIPAEAAVTGEDPLELAALVIQQYEGIKAALRTPYGHIEGRRRAKIAEIAAAADIAGLQSIADTDWS